MREITNVLSTINYWDRHWDAIEAELKKAGARQITHVPMDDRAAISAALADADVALLNGDMDDQIRNEGKMLRWVHCNHAGANLSARPEIFERGILLSCSAGRSGPVLAEHTFYLLLSLIYASRIVEEQQRGHVWKTIYDDMRGLYGKTMGIIGLGYTGKEVARRAKAFDMEVLAYDRAFAAAPADVDRWFSADAGDSVDALLGESDVVVLSCRLSDETYHLINRSKFAIMKGSALLVNISRGSVVDEEDLVEALKNKAIAGAASDVFEREPLPASSELWDLPNFVMTPHCTPEMPDMPGNCVGIIKENIQRYIAGETLLNQQTARDVYTK
ncbi:MAG: D-2-hydroxyacid dehydrogenase [Lachnospiraceae bacterium]|jgi:phosphoglycerate dehydrogenase-like enzyme|nr:D-2-hydroxyacid dehydrogenase [Lachnospiraceae bacterium]